MKFKKASIFTTLVIAVLMLYAVISLVMVHRQTRQLQDRAHQHFLAVGDAGHLAADPAAEV